MVETLFIVLQSVPAVEGYDRVITALTGLVAAVFAGYVAIRSLPQLSKKTEDVKQATAQVHELVNSNFTEQKKKIESLEKTIVALQEELLGEDLPPEPDIVPDTA